VKVIFDTSVIVASLVTSHPSHDRAFPWLSKVKSGDIEMIVACHSLAETYAVLSTLPLSPRITPILAWRLVHENIETAATLISLSASDYSAVIRRMGERGLSGGIIYDMIVVMAAEKEGVDRLLTLNTRDFIRIWPEGKNRILSLL